jgi:polar amino acid transport system substrate-binding protein
MLLRNILLVIILIYHSSIKAENYVVGVHNLYNFPLNYINNSNDFLGKYRNLLDKFAQDHNLKLTYKPLGKNDLLASFLNSEVDFKFPDNPFWSASRKKHKDVIYSIPISIALEGTFILSSNKNKFNKLNNIKTIGLIGDVISWSMHHDFELYKISTIKDTDCRNLIEKLLDKKIDAIYCNYDVVIDYIKEMNLEDLVYFNTNLPYIDDYYHLSTINHPEIIEKFNTWLKRSSI